MPSWWIALATLVVLAPTLAHTPQSGDGAEIVTAALRGGVLHPTGFPLQAWLDRALVRIPGASPTLAISALGLVAHAGAAGLVAEILRLLGVAVSGRVLGAAAFALFPPLWGLDVAPEVFSLAHLIVAAVMLVAVRAGRPGRDPGGAKRAVGLGLLGAAGIAQHPIAIAGLPALAVAATRMLKREPRRLSSLAWLLAALVGGTVVAYASLPLLRTSSPWPDWGRLATPGDVLRHVLRLDYGAFSLAAVGGPGARTGLSLWLEELLRWWNVAVVLALAGAMWCWRRGPRSTLAAIAGVLVVGVAILWRGRLAGHSADATYLEKLQGPATLAAAVLVGLGLQALRERLARKTARRVVDGAVAVATVAALALGWPRANAAGDRTLGLFALGIAQELPPEAVYVTEGEVEAFMGARTPEGWRFPISTPMASFPWYTRQVAPRLEPRVPSDSVSIEDWDGFLLRCFEQHLAVACTNDEVLRSPYAVPELRGLLYVARAGAGQELTDSTIVAAVRLAPLAAQLPRLRPGVRPYSRFFVRRFARAYAGAAEALRRRGSPGLAAQADSIAMALDQGASLELRGRLLREFAARPRPAALDRSPRVAP